MVTAPIPKFAENYQSWPGQILGGDGEDYHQQKISALDSGCWLVFWSRNGRWTGLEHVPRLHWLGLYLYFLWWSFALMCYKETNCWRQELLPRPCEICHPHEAPLNANSSPSSCLEGTCFLAGRQNVYDDAYEFWVVVRERGSHEQVQEVEERKKSKQKLEARKSEANWSL